MENNDNFFFNGQHQIKVNKRQISQNMESNNLLNEIQIYNDNFPTRNFISKTIQQKISNNDNHEKYLSQSVSGNQNIYNDIPNSLSTSRKELKYKKININKKNIKNENRPFNRHLFLSYLNNNNNNKRKVIEDDINGKKLLICKSETQYPLSFRKGNVIIDEEHVIKNSNYSPHQKDINLRYYTMSSKFGQTQGNEIRNKKNYINDEESNNIMIDYETFSGKKELNNYPNEAFSNITYNNLGHNIYQPINEQINNNTNYYYNNHENVYFDNMNFANNNNNFINFPSNIPYMSRTLNNINGFGNQEYIQFFDRNNVNNNFYKDMNVNNNKIINNNNDIILEESSIYNTIRNDNKDKELLIIYKEKLIQIFVKFMMNFYFKYLKRIYEEFIYQLKNYKNNFIFSNKRNFMNKIYNEKENMENDDEIKNNYYYIKKNNLKNNNNNFHYYDPSPIKYLSSHKKSPTKAIFRRMDRNKNSNNLTENEEERNLFNAKISSYKNHNVRREKITKNLSNLYVPVKNRRFNNNYNNYISCSRKKTNIFNELKINKSTKLKEKNQDNIDNSTYQMNNFYKTSSTNFYTHKKSHNSVNFEIEKPKLILSKINQRNNKYKITNEEEEPKINIQVHPIFYKKVMSKEKNLNVYKKKTREISKGKNKYKNDLIFNDRHTTNEIIKNNYFSNNLNSINNNENNSNTNNINNITNISNDINNYYLYDKPMNMIYLKNNSNMDIEDESLVTPDKGGNNLNSNEKLNQNVLSKQYSDENLFDIINLIQIKTEDKRLFINFNYAIFDYNCNNQDYKINKNDMIFSKVNSLYIPSVISNENEINSISQNYSFKDNADTINTNLNRYAKKRKLKSGIFKLDNIFNNKIYKNKSKFFEYLKKIKSCYFLYEIIHNFYKNQIRKFFNICKKNIYTRQRHTHSKKQFQVSYKENIETNKEKEDLENNSYNENIKDKKNNNNVKTEPNNNNETNYFQKKISKLQGRKNLKFSIKKNSIKNDRKIINMTEDSDNDGNKKVNISFEDKKKIDTNILLPLWKSTEFSNLKVHLPMRKQKTVYLKKRLSHKI